MYFQQGDSIYNVYERVCYVYYTYLIVHDHTRFHKIVQGSYSFYKSCADFFLERLSDDQKTRIGTRGRMLENRRTCLRPGGNNDWLGLKGRQRGRLR
jgi:hypothetical protein